VFNLSKCSTNVKALDEAKIAVFNLSKCFINVKAPDDAKIAVLRSSI
jgi:hypothetical protein